MNILGIVLCFAQVSVFFKLIFFDNWCTNLTRNNVISVVHSHTLFMLFYGSHFMWCVMQIKLHFFSLCHTNSDRKTNRIEKKTKNFEHFANFFLYPNWKLLFALFVTSIGLIYICVMVVRACVRVWLVVLCTNRCNC